MKIIRLTDTHVVGDGLLYGQNPAARLRAAVQSINAEHGDADCVIVTGDLTHRGEPAAFAAFKAEIDALTMPVHLMVGNHDAPDALLEAFPNTARDSNGFVQSTFETPFGTFCLLDTKAEGTHSGTYCTARLEWLEDRLQAGKDAVYLFMHHPPFAVGIAAMDQIMLQNAELFWEVVAPHRDRIRHLFFGHIHRAIFGNWRGISYSCMRGLNHQVALDLSGGTGAIAGNFEPPAYGVVLISDDTVVVHLHDFLDGSDRFFL